MANRAIGVQREKPLHAALKRWYAETDDAVEVALDGYVIDLVRGDLLIEIQTRGFAGMKRKVGALLAAGHRIRVVHPIAVERDIVKVDDDGQLLGRRRSPRHGALADLADELVSLPGLLAHPAFELEVLLTREEELRRFEAGRCWRRKGWMVLERRLVEVVERVAIGVPADLARLLPDGLADPFTTAELAAGLRRPRRTAQQLAYCLRRLELVEVVGTRDRSTLYRLVAAPSPGA